jgi:hypothetical protein
MPRRRALWSGLSALSGVAEKPSFQTAAYDLSRAAHRASAPRTLVKALQQPVAVRRGKVVHLVHCGSVTETRMRCGADSGGGTDKDAGGGEERFELREGLDGGDRDRVGLILEACGGGHSDAKTASTRAHADR